MKIAVLGTGLMGAPMVRRLLGAGRAVIVWNRTAVKAEALAADGAEVASSARAAVADADIVLTMLENAQAVGAVLFDEKVGVAAALKTGALVVDMSSIPPGAAREHAGRLAESGAGHVDAPVSGGVPGAEAGTLAIMAGGPADLVARAAAALSPLGRWTHVGPAGAGQLAKLANQAIVGVTLTVVAEALMLARAGGADPAAVRDAIRGGFAESRVLELHGAKMLARDFRPGGRASIQLKDMDTVLATAAELGLRLPAVEAAREVFARLVAQGGADLDHSATLVALEDMNGLAPARAMGRDAGNATKN
ncbi:NAD(P)-dependent oxidoreductase [Futiania mangrovi]|uniref:NAD(P)-dependent oxidoreductase n=1 Tax=Futiania mangrovi TaxID=2959716 RepID=A0A9J6PHS3_9PROT|nr:NAD(P)-dependent oxidoreductase [Futiania mangrovii]MCP1337355.1 NAD(P)-dependent oxidoreductase [Futiania mangrovii]